MKIIVENSTWNNVGDAFYQSTLYALINKLYPNDTVVMGEGPITRAFRPKKYIDNCFRLLEYQQADVHVFSGPILRFLLKEYADKIKEIKERGANYILVSVSSADIAESLRLETGKFLEKYPPLLLSTRDEETYHKFKDFKINTYNGFCTSFLVNKLLPVDTFTMAKPFFISSFYEELEPVFKSQGEVTIENVTLDRKTSFLGLDYKYSRHLNKLRPQQAELDSHKIIRVHQDLSTHFYHIKFSHPNSFMSFNPLSYLALYKSTDFTISDRVHSCAVTLAFGKPARLFTNTPRAGIFDRLGYKFKSGEIIRPISTDVIDREQDLLADKIVSSLS